MQVGSGRHTTRWRKVLRHMFAPDLRPLASVLQCSTLIVVSGLLLAGCGDGSTQQHQRRKPTPVPVAVKQVKPGMVDVYATYPGRIRGAREVEVRSRVEGILLQRHYNEGDFVKKGQLLFTINPEPFQATVEQRQAQLEKAKAKLDQARENWQRVSQLYEVNAVSEAERDKARAELETAQANVHLAQANLKTAQIKLDYASIDAPLSGVTSLEEVDVGALITQGTLLTTITHLDPVHVRFSIPAEDALMRQRALAVLDQNTSVKATRKAKLILPSGKTYKHTGHVDFTQSTIDPTTGTVRLRAVFPNAEHRLVPGRFVSVRIRLETRHDTIVIPNKAITDSQTQTRVYIVTDDNKAKAVPVKLGPTVEGGRIITQGLEAGDRVIVIGLGQVKPGATVQIKPHKKLAIGDSAGDTNKADLSAGAANKTASAPNSRPANPASAPNTNKRDQ